MISRLAFRFRRFQTDNARHVANLQAMQDWADEVRRNLVVMEADSAEVATAETRTAATYGNLTTTGPTITVRTRASGKVLVILSARIKAGAGGAAGMAVEVTDSTGATVHAPAFGDTAQTDDTANTDVVERTTLVQALAHDTNHTFTARYIGNGANPSTFSYRRMTVIPL